MKKLVRSVPRVLEKCCRANGADTGRAVGERNEPEPAIVEPDDADIALGLSRQPARAGEMAEDRGAGVSAGCAPSRPAAQRAACRGPRHRRRRRPAIAALRPSASRPVMSGGASSGKSTAVTRQSFDHRGALGGGVLQQDVIENRAADLKRIREALVPGIGEIVSDVLAVIGRDEFDAVFADRACLDLRAHAQAGRTAADSAATAIRRYGSGDAGLSRAGSPGGHVPPAMSRSWRRRGRRRPRARRNPALPSCLFGPDSVPSAESPPVPEDMPQTINPIPQPL